MTPPQVPAPQDDIGPFFRLVGGALALGIILALLLQVRDHHTFDKWDAVIYGIVALLLLGMIRPRFVDSLSKTIADKLPFLSFTKSGS